MEMESSEENRACYLIGKRIAAGYGHSNPLLLTICNNEPELKCKDKSTD